jgi:predicted PhzF superfamily epimerase YddE/YHI9
LIIFVNDRKTLAEMSYPFEEVKALMDEEGLTTISILWRESDELFHSRNPFASGGVYEDPATGAAAAALAGYLRERFKSSRIRLGNGHIHPNLPD